MGLSKRNKIKPLLDEWMPHSVATSEWLGERGIIPQDVRNYLRSKWLESLGRGAFKRPHETVTWQGALYSLQKQLNIPVHVGALTALEMTGHQHYVRFGTTRAYIFSAPGVVLPKWFLDNCVEESARVVKWGAVKDDDIVEIGSDANSEGRNDPKKHVKWEAVAIELARSRARPWQVYAFALTLALAGAVAMWLALFTLSS